MKSDNDKGAYVAGFFMGMAVVLAAVFVSGGYLLI